MKVIITVLIFPMQKQSHKTAVNLFPQGHTATTVVEHKAATAILVSCLYPVVRDPFCPVTPLLHIKIISNGILSSEGRI